MKQCGEVGSGAPSPAGRFKGDRRTRIIRLATVCGLALLAAAALYLALRRHLSLQTLAENHEALRALVAERRAAAFTLYCALYVALAALSLPGCVMLSAAGGLLFGQIAGAAGATAGATVGATLFFIVARTSLGAFLPGAAAPRIATLRSRFQEDALSYMLFLRLTPAFPFGAVNLAAAFLNMRVRDFALGTFLGVIPAALVFASAGAGVEHVLQARRAAQEQCLGDLAQAAADSADGCAVALGAADLLTRENLLLLAALGAMALTPAIFKKLRKSVRRDA